MARSINWAIDFISKKNFIALNVGSNKWAFTIKKLANIVAKTMGNVEVEVNKNSQPDKRSYTVDFSLFKKLCKKYQPKENLEQCKSVLRAAALTYVAGSIVSIFRLRSIFLIFIGLFRMVLRR